MAQNLNETFKTCFSKFFNDCMPLCSEGKFVYFMSSSNQIYGFDIDKNILFEPNTTNKSNLLDQSIKIHFSESDVSNFESLSKLKFTDLVELIIKPNYKEKYLGRKYFFAKPDTIFIWTLVSKKWEKSDVDALRHIFKNSEIFIEYTARVSEKTKSLEELGIEYNDLEEIGLRFKDASIHYFHNKLNKIYSLNMATNNWYTPSANFQKQLLEHMESKKSESESLSN
jgi:hypothetical protein